MFNLFHFITYIFKEIIMPDLSSSSKIPQNTSGYAKNQSSTETINDDKSKNYVASRSDTSVESADIAERTVENTVTDINNEINKILKNEQDIKNQKKILESLIPKSVFETIKKNTNENNLGENQDGAELSAPKSKLRTIKLILSAPIKILINSLYIIPAVIKLVFLLEYKHYHLNANSKKMIYNNFLPELVLSFFNQNDLKEEAKGSNDAVAETKLADRVHSVCKEIAKKISIKEFQKKESEPNLQGMFLEVLKGIHDTEGEEFTAQEADKKMETLTGFIQTCKDNLDKTQDQAESENDDDVQKYRNAFNLALKKHIKGLEDLKSNLEKGKKT